MPSSAHALRSLRSHITWVFGGFVALVVLLLSILAGEVLKIRLQHQAGQSLAIVAHNAALLLQQELQQQIRRTKALAQSKELWLQGLDSRAVADTLHRVQLISPHNVWIGVTDTQGRVQNATGNLLRGSDVSQRPWFQAALRGPFISEVHPAKLLADLLPRNANGEPLRLVDFSAPIHHPDGRLLGVVGIHGSWDWVRDVVERLLQGSSQAQQQSLFIFDASGTLIYAPGGVLAPFDTLDQRLPAPFASGQRAPTLAAWTDRTTPYLTAGVRLLPPQPEHDLGWWVVARQPVEAAYADANRVLWSAIALGLLAVVLAAAIAWHLARHVSDDLNQLAQAAEHIASARNAHIPLLCSNREVAQLSRALHTMTEQLLHANHAMQEQVRQRTQELQAANAALERQANTDALTQLLNRRGFEQHASVLLALARRSGRPLSAVALDIDFFKRINDSYGHDVGDQVLRRLAELLRQRMRQADVVARLGGEEFVLLLPDTGTAAAHGVAQQLLHTVAQHPFPTVGSLTLSAGVSSLLTTPSSDGLDELLKRSDEALYEAKRTGRNRVCVHAATPH